MRLILPVRRRGLGTIASFAVLFTTGSANAAAYSGIDGTKLSLFWMLPFAGILGSLALFPMVAPHFWHRNYGYAALFWGLAFLLPFGAVFGAGAALRELVHVLIVEYIPLIALIGALFAIAGGIYIGGALRASPGLNFAIMLIGTILAGVAGTTAAAMILIRPLIRANQGRRYKAHTIVFFIFLVCNIGGALIPLGNPPLFLGYLEGVHFFWPVRALWPHTAVMAALVLGAFFALDSHFFGKEGERKISEAHSEAPFIRGLINVPLLFLTVAAVAVSGSDGDGKVEIFGTALNSIEILRDLALIGLGAASLALTPRVYREQNDFNWAPVLEVAMLFAAIFVTIVPAIAILKAGPHGGLAPLLTLLGTPGAPNNAAYFWLTGILSSFLDNAPTYLIFFNAAGGDPETLMGPMSQTLAAISAGAVFMGANTYIGNAPNFMVKAIAEHLGVKMPGFLGFMLWSGAVLIPAFVLLTVIFFQ
jgi:Na+/H+ antiporter NhaD/arsenite permease-like protein